MKRLLIKSKLNIRTGDGFMLMFLSLTVLTVASWIWYKNDEWNGFAFGSMLITTVVLGISLIALPVTYYDYLSELERYEALKHSIEISRQDEVSDIERAALIQTIANYNADIASTRFWNDTIFDIYIPDELAELKYLK